MKNIWKQFVDDILPKQPINLGEITASHGNGRYSVKLVSGDSIRAYYSADLKVGDKVKLIGNRIDSKAPNLPIHRLEIQ